MILKARSRLPAPGEFDAIAQAFNEMTVKFKEAQANMVEQERMRKEMQVAQDIQHTLLPKNFPDIEGFDIATIYRAAKDVGGDYYDFVWIDENTLGIVVADVSGKGVPGSLVMTMIRTAIRLESRGNRSPVDILTRVNEFVTEDVRKGMFITIFLVVLDTRNRKISFSSAGHNPMMLYRKEEDKTFFLNPKGIPLGINLPEGVSFEDNLRQRKRASQEGRHVGDLHRRHHRSNESAAGAVSVSVAILNLSKTTAICRRTNSPRSSRMNCRVSRRAPSRTMTSRW